MAIDLNADVGELFKQLLSRRKLTPTTPEATLPGQAAESYRKLYLIPLLASVIVILAVIAYVYGYMTPESNKLARQENRLEEILQKQQELGNLDAQIRSFQHVISDSRAYYEESLSHFASHDDLESLYQAISTLALMYDLKVVHIKGGVSEKSPYADVVQVTPVDIELVGKFTDYMNFKHDLAHDRRLLTVRKEALKVKDEVKEPGVISAMVTLESYTIEKQPFYEAMRQTDHLVARFESSTQGVDHEIQ
ncbi:MAG: type 4a pilus biogenesis protein PilO [Hyphomicrobiales bacterium]|nr:type 4a pilus biogenesis protein PilO [Rickettsiales bacterium]MCP5362313.1 type 4a pilus biogenesis protein PilO [Hyphomicrobiales bacterium]